MTVLTASAPRGLASGWRWPEGRTARLAAQTTAFMLALAVPTALAAGLDERLLATVPVWAKPLKFDLSLAFHFVTLGLLLGLVRPAVRDGRTLYGVMIAAAAAGLMEIGYITLQAARGRASHFNNDTPIEAAMYGVMGVGAVLLVLVAVAVAVAIQRAPRPEVGGGLRLGAVVGLGLGAVTTLLIAGLMSTGEVTGGGGHLVGPAGAAAAGLPLVGWSTVTGDLRVPHFFATHIMQALPLAGLVADRLRPGRSRPLVLLAAALWTLVILGTFVQALAGHPLLALS